MKPHYTDDRVTLYHGDCIEVMRSLPDSSVDAVVTDPPYGLEFMGKGWDAPWKQAGDVIADPASVGGFQDGAGGNPFSRSRIRYGREDGASVGFQLWFTEVATEALRVLKPGGHLLAFGGTRTWHRLASAIEDAGFEVRDSIAWMYGSGFPKSHDVSKGIDKTNGEVGRLHKFTAWMRSTGITGAAINTVTDTNMGGHYLTAASQPAIPTPELWKKVRPVCQMLTDVPAWVDELVERIAAEREVVGSKTSGIANKDEGQRYTIGASKSVQVDITAPATPAAQQWQGWGTALKPAFEPIVVARKPLIGTVAANVLTHGTGALNIDGCRIGTEGGGTHCTTRDSQGKCKGHDNAGRSTSGATVHGDNTTAGRWPANVILDESQAAELDKQSGVSVSGKRPPTGKAILDIEAGWNANSMTDKTERGFEDTGGASRFFYTAKANSSERPNVDGVAHPTVKPLDLMRYLVRLVTPPGGTVLEPFAGSGTTAEACIIEGFKCIAIEMTDEYLPLILDRITKPIETVMF
jgi:DNA modification methylase